MRTVVFLFCLAASVAFGQDTMVELTYMDQPRDGGGYVTRYLVTERWLRMDYGQDRDDFVLFDRSANVVYNVVHDQRTVLVIEPGPVTLPRPVSLEVSEEMLLEEHGQKTFEVRVNGFVCSRITSAPGLLSDVNEALGAFQMSMRAAQDATFVATPAELRHPCELARFLFEPLAWFKNGLIFHEADATGHVRRLTDYRAGVPLRPAAFVLPEGYRRVRLSELQGRAP